MSILNYTAGCKSVLCILLPTLFFLSCKNSQEVKKDKYLGVPQTNSILLRIKPNALVQKYSELFTADSSNVSKDSSSTEDELNSLPSNLGLLNSLIESAPVTSDLVKKHFLNLQPDLSKNWLGGGNVFDHNSYAFLYLSYSNQNYLTDFLKKQSISVLEKEGVEYCFLDETEEIQVLLAKQDNHLLFLSHNGQKDSLISLFESTLFNSKNDFLSFYKETFDAQENDIDIKVSPSKTLTAKVSSPIIKDVMASSQFMVSLSLNDNRLSLAITPDKGIFIDSLFNEVEHTNTGLIHLSTNLDLAKTKLFLDHYELMGSLNHELNKAALNYDKLEQLITGEIEVSYLGKETSKEKAITYEYDDNFNKIEKVKYITSSSHGISGKIILTNGKNSINEFKKRKWIVPNSKNKYEFIALSKSPIYLENNSLLIGKKTNDPKSKHKFFLAINDTESFVKTLKIKKAKDYNYFKSGALILDKNNKLTLELETKKNTRELVILVKDVFGLN